MREVTIAAIQMSCSRDVKENIEKAAKLIRDAAEAGAQIILPSELFERQYFCQERRYDYYDYAKPLSENDAVQSMKALAKELGVVIPVSFYEAGEGRQLFNSVAVIDATERCLEYTERHISRTIIIIRRSFTSHREIQALKLLRQDMQQLESVYAGISGSRKRQEAWL